MLALVTIAASYVLFMYFEQRRLWDGISYWRNEAGNLAADIVSNLEDLAYYDPITGLPNANALQRELSSGQHENQCLILTDLQDFGSVKQEAQSLEGR